MKPLSNNPVVNKYLKEKLMNKLNKILFAVIVISIIIIYIKEVYFTL